jgi:Gamma tubulin complex component C-terminal
MLLSSVIVFVYMMLLMQVMVEHDLLSHLRAHKKFLLLSQGDFVTTLLDTVSAELSKYY